MEYLLKVNDIVIIERTDLGAERIPLTDNENDNFIGTRKGYKSKNYRKYVV